MSICIPASEAMQILGFSDEQMRDAFDAGLPIYNAGMTGDGRKGE